MPTVARKKLTVASLSVPSAKDQEVRLVVHVIQNVSGSNDKAPTSPDGAGSSKSEILC